MSRQSSSNGSAPWSTVERNRLNRSLAVESNLGGSRLTVAFVGGISEGITDEFILRLLSTCGPVSEWKRVTDAANAPKSFGFCNYESADGLGRALKLLNDLPLFGNKKLIVRVDEKTRAYLDRYGIILGKEKIEASSKEADLDAASGCLLLAKELNLISGIEFIERLIEDINTKDYSFLTVNPKEEGEADEDDGGKSLGKESVSVMGDNRLYDTAIRKSIIPDAFQLSRLYWDRLEEWEGHEERAFERRKKREKDLERMRNEGEEGRTALEHFLSSFDDELWIICAVDEILGLDFAELNGKSHLRIRKDAPEFYKERSTWFGKRSRVRDAESMDEKIDLNLISIPSRLETAVGLSGKGLSDLLPLVQSLGPVKNESVFLKVLFHLSEKIANNLEDLYSTAIDWLHFDRNYMDSLLGRKCRECNFSQQLANQLLCYIEQRSGARDILNADESAFCISKDQLELFLPVIWRHLIFSTLSKSIGLDLTEGLS